ncbi:hypothetical protein LJR084_001948 [Variovorax sp. LjRoot84]|uniref:hypothetical protein n=1 Tax=Variovorax sp. LjRoot84 TaxID=3342340 RepID=UPI003ECEE547
MKIGKYTVSPKAVHIVGRGFFGTAEVRWEEGDSTYETTMHFGEPFATEEEANLHALQQVELRVRDGVGVH